MFFWYLLQWRNVSAFVPYQPGECELKKLVLVLGMLALVSLACAGSSLPFVATATPYPTYTPYPTATAYPTLTPYPTYTPYPTPVPPATAEGSTQLEQIQGLVDQALVFPEIPEGCAYTSVGNELPGFFPLAPYGQIVRSVTWDDGENNCGIAVVEFFMDPNLAYELWLTTFAIFEPDARAVDTWSSNRQAFIEDDFCGDEICGAEVTYVNNSFVFWVIIFNADPEVAKEQLSSYFTQFDAIMYELFGQPTGSSAY